MALERQHILAFEKTINYPVLNYLTAFIDFVQKDYSHIIDYYSGSTKSVNSVAFSNLQILLKEVNKIFEAIKFNKTRLTNYSDWEIIAQIEENYNRLLTIDNSPKWLRSTIGKNNFNTNIEVNIPFRQGQTLESITKNVLGSSNPDDDWADLAIKNDLEEEGYTSEGGIMLKANFDFNSQGFELKSIVDVLQGDRILGVDMNKKLAFIEGEDGIQDLETLEPEATFIQTVKILAQLRKGDNPEFPNSGVNARLVAGSNVNSVTYPILSRQLNETFKTDDTIKSIEVTELKRDQDAISLSFNVESQLESFEAISVKL